MKTTWTVEDIKDLTGKTIIVTGANSGLGFEASKIYASKGATVIMACRSLDRAETAKHKIQIEYKDADLDIMQLDLGSLKSIENFVKAFKTKYSSIDILLNNAGIMTVPYGLTEDGFELQNGVNHLGHFALTAQLFPIIKKTPQARIVNVSSVAHKSGKIDFNNYLFEKGKYKRFKSYSRSKLSNLLFTYELDRRVKEKDIDIKVLVAHPGVSGTELGRYIDKHWLTKPIAWLAYKIVQSPYAGCLPEVRASLDETALSGQYYGPKGIFEMRGKPVLTKSNKRSHDKELAKKLWDKSEKMTGITFTV